MLALHNVCKNYRTTDVETRALADISFEIQDGEFVAIMGPSGCGKSTLLNILGLLDQPSAGSYRLADQEVANASERKLTALRRDLIGFVFQSFNLLPRLDILENVELPMIYAGISRKERHERARKAIEAVDLSHRIHNRPSQLSGGQCQRVAIARALVNDPKIILADEPTGALDTQTGEAILKLFRQLHEKGHTVALVTHDPDIAAETPRRIELRDGKVVDSAHSHYVRFRTEAAAAATPVATDTTTSNVPQA